MQRWSDKRKQKRVAPWLVETSLDLPLITKQIVPLTGGVVVQ
jgi:hypothetical protein